MHQALDFEVCCMQQAYRSHNYIRWQCHITCTRTPLQPTRSVKPRSGNAGGTCCLEHILCPQCHWNSNDGDGHIQQQLMGIQAFGSCCCIQMAVAVLKSSISSQALQCTVPTSIALRAASESPPLLPLNMPSKGLLNLFCTCSGCLVSVLLIITRRGCCAAALRLLKLQPVALLRPSCSEDCI